MSRIVLEPLEKSSLAEWFATDAGRYVLEWEQAQVDSAIEDVFGFNAVQIGVPTIDFLRENRIPFRFTASQEPGGALAADPVQLPIASQSVDLVVLPHTLEFCADPHGVLREAERVLMPEGQIVICGFNPLSLWGLARLRYRRRRQYPWRGEFISLLRLRDWLKLLGFELNGGKFGRYAPPFRNGRWVQRFRFMESAGDRWWPITGGVYVVRAVKRTLGMRVVTPAWRTRRSEARALAAVARRQGWPQGQSPEGGPMLRLIAAQPLRTAPAGQLKVRTLRVVKPTPGEKT